jgi:glycerophosphoryl diester phosphodiesterase
MKIFPFLLFLMIFPVISGCSGHSKKDRSSPGERSVLVIAHRGGAHLAPENTLAAFRNAIALGVDMIEIDVHLSKDGHVVVIHDNTVDRTTDGHGRIADLTLAEIKKMDAGKKFDEKFAGEKVPTLEETMETLNGKVQLLIEIKKDHDTLYPGLEEKVVEIIRHYDAGKWTIVQSFNKHSVEKVQKADSSLRTFYLLGHNFPEWYGALSQSLQEGRSPQPAYTGIAPHWSVLDAGKVDTLHQAGYQLYTWTVGPEEMQKILDMKVDGIITNDPDKLITLLKK